jgi:hypothetical protein
MILIKIESDIDFTALLKREEGFDENNSSYLEDEVIQEDSDDNSDDNSDNNSDDDYTNSDIISTIKPNGSGKLQKRAPQKSENMIVRGASQNGNLNALFSDNIDTDSDRHH